MMPILVTDQAPVPPPLYHRAQGQRERWLLCSQEVEYATLPIPLLLRDKTWYVFA
jgi:hypothetical protein